MRTIRPNSRLRHSRYLSVVAVLTATAVLAACSSTAPTHTASPGTGGPSGSLVVWTDATRQPMVEAYAKAHPAVKVDIVSMDMGGLDTKLQLLSRDKSKWPDVVFTPNGEGAKLHDTLGFSADLASSVSSTVQSGFGKTLTACSEGGHLYCLPLDVSTQMLFYNKTLMDQFGYTVPTTWADYQALTQRVATEHHGYVVGSCGDGFCPNVYYRASGCVGETLQDATTVTVDLPTEDKCTRVTQMLDPLLADGSVAKLSPFDPDFAALGSSNKILMLPGFVWYGALLFQNTFKNANGQIAVAALPTWPDGASGLGAAVGGQWLVSSVTKNTTAAVDLATWGSTNADILAQQVTFPAYAPAAAAWSAKAAGSGFYAADPTPVFTQARTAVAGDLYTPPGFDLVGTFGSAVAPGLKTGGTLAGQTDAWVKAMTQTAKDAGYTVTAK